MLQFPSAQFVRFPQIHHFGTILAVILDEQRKPLRNPAQPLLSVGGTGMFYMIL
jgi:hypothetical protein